MIRMLSLFLLLAASAGAGEWISFPRTGVRIVSPENRNGSIREEDGLSVRWEAEGKRPYIQLGLRRNWMVKPLEEFSGGEFTLELKTTGRPLRMVHLRFSDATGETFQYTADKRFRFQVPGKPSGVWGGNKDKKIDWPLRFESLVLSVEDGTSGEAELGALSFTADGVPDVSLETGGEFGLLTQKTPVLAFRNKGSKGVPLAGKLTLRDAFGPAGEFELPARELAAGETFSYPIPGDFSRQGIWYLDCGFAKKNFTFGRIVPAGPTAGTPKGFLFGVQAHPEFYSPGEQTEMARAAALCGIKLVRLPSYWDSIHKKQTDWDIGYFDRIAAPWLAQNISLMPIFGRPPEWAVAAGSVRPHQPVKSRHHLRPDYDAYESFARRLADHCKGKAILYESWNEPDIYFANFTIDESLELQRRAYRAVKAADPAARVTTGGFAHAGSDRAPGPKQGIIRRTLAEAQGSFDLLAFHGHGPFAGYASQLDYLTKLRQATGSTAPWFASETAIPSFGIGELKQAEVLFQKLIYSWAKGSAGYIWYNLREKGFHASPRERTFGMLTPDLRIKAVYVAYNALAGHFGGAEFLREAESGEGSYAYLFRATDGSTLLSCWNAGGERLLLVSGIDGPVSRIDLFGNETPLEAREGRLLARSGEHPATLRIRGKEPLAGDLVRLDRPPVIRAGQSGSFGFTLCNPTTEELEIGLAADSVTLKPGEKRKLRMELEAMGESQLNLTLTVKPFAPAELAIPVFTARPVPAAFRLDRAEQFHSLVASAEGNEKHLWRNPADLSADIRLACDGKALKIRAEVVDDIHHQPFGSAEGWNGDSIQFALKLPEQPDFWEFCLLLDNGGKTNFSCTRAPSGFSAGRAAAAAGRKVTRDEAAKKTFYEAEIPLEAVGLDRRGEFQFNLIVNDNDGELRKGFLMISRGLGESKNPALYPYWHL